MKLHMQTPHVVDCGLTSHSAIFRIYSDGTLMSYLLVPSKSFREECHNDMKNLETGPIVEGKSGA